MRINKIKSFRYLNLYLVFFISFTLLVLFYTVSISFIPMRYRTKYNAEGRDIMKFLIRSSHRNDLFYLIDGSNNQTHFFFLIH